jgi:hypothetical protein
MLPTISEEGVATIALEGQDLEQGLLQTPDSIQSRTPRCDSCLILATIAGCGMITLLFVGFGYLWIYVTKNDFHSSSTNP